MWQLGLRLGLGPGNGVFLFFFFYFKSDILVYMSDLNIGLVRHPGLFCDIWRQHWTALFLASLFPCDYFQICNECIQTFHKCPHALQLYEWEYEWRTTSLVWPDVARLKGYCVTVASKMRQASSTVAHDRQGRLHAYRWRKLCTMIEVASGKNSFMRAHQQQRFSSWFVFGA